MPRLIIVLCLAGIGCAGAGGVPPEQHPYDSGGRLMPEQAAYDVRHYDLSLRIDPSQRSIDGELSIRALAVEPLPHLVLDLDPRFEVTGVWQDPDVGREPLDFFWRGSKLWVTLPEPAEPGQPVELVVRYRGSPREAPRPPWQGGFTWAETADGSPWVGVSCQVDGADVWWPCKDHPSDEPDEGMEMHFTIPAGLACVSNGRLLGVTDVDEGWRTHHWVVSTPINTYDVTVNLGPFEPVTAEYTDLLGDSRLVTWWALPESVERAERLLDELTRQLRFLEEELGPYPFRADKLAVVDTPYLAMEHQTAVALGLDGDAVRGRFHYILLHEVTHEWWGNLASASDWRDFWLHEGFAGYMEARYAERLGGEEAFHRYLREFFRPGVLNLRPVAPREPRSLRQVFVTVEGANGSFSTWDADAYLKGALVLQTLRWLVGDAAMADVLRRWAYPRPELERVVDGRQCRAVSTDEFQRHAESATGLDLGWFFEVYLRQPRLPRLVTDVRDGELRLRWRVPRGLPFPMPVEVRLGDETRRVPMPEGEAKVVLPSGVEPIVDPDGWILRK